MINWDEDKITIVGFVVMSLLISFATGMLVGVILTACVQ